MLDGSEQSLLIPPSKPSSLGFCLQKGGACLVPKATAAHRGIPQCSSFELDVASTYLDGELQARPRALGEVIVHAYGFLHGQLWVSLTDACQGWTVCNTASPTPILIQTLYNQTHPSTSLA